MQRTSIQLALATSAMLLCSFVATAQERPTTVPIRSITKLHGAMHNTITGVGLVTGLNKTGSGDEATRQAAANLIKRYNLKITPSQLTTGSIALVSVSAELPPFAHVGAELDVSVKALGDAVSLEGGFLEQCSLVYYDGPNSTVYATSSGIVSTGGFGAEGRAAKVTRNNPTTGRITNGARVVQALSPSLLSEAGDLELILRNPSLRTAHNIVAGINRTLSDGGIRALVQDEALVRIVLPETARNRHQVLRVLDLIRDISVVAENPQKVVIHQDTGTIIAGAGIQISPCVIASSDMTISIIDEEEVSQPLPGINNPGTTERVDRTRIEVETTDSGLRPLKGGGASVGELLENLKALELTPRQLIEVFRELKKGGFLQAPLEVH